MQPVDSRADIMETDPEYFYYRGDQLVNIIQGQGQSRPGQRFFQTAIGLTAQMNVGGNAGTWLIGTDVLGNVLGGSDGGNGEEHCYAPYGGEKHQGSTENVIKLGYTGAYRDPLTGLYPLGNGCRFYLPELMCFNKADSLSPFGAGGINTRSYCENDPINYSDPSGQAKATWRAGGGLMLSLIGIVSGFAAIFSGGLSIAAMVAAGSGVIGALAGVASAAVSDEELKDIFAYVSLAFGTVSAVTSLGMGGKKLLTRLEDRRYEATLRHDVARLEALPPNYDEVIRSETPPPSYESVTGSMSQARTHEDELQRLRAPSRADEVASPRLSPPDDFSNVEIEGLSHTDTDPLTSASSRRPRVRFHRRSPKEGRFSSYSVGDSENLNAEHRSSAESFSLSEAPGSPGETRSHSRTPRGSRSRRNTSSPSSNSLNILVRETEL